MSKDINLRRRSVAWATALGYAATLVTIVRNILLVPFYLRYVSLAEYGAWLATGAALVQMLVTDFGLAGTLMQRVAALYGARDTTRLGPVVASGLAAAAGLALTLTTLTLLAAPFLPAMRGLSSAQIHEVSNCFTLAAFANALGIIAYTAFGLVRGLQRVGIAGTAILIGELANIGTTIALLLSGAGLYAIADGLIARSAVATLLLLGYLVLYRTRLDLTLRLQWHEVRDLFVDSWHSFLSTLALTLQTRSNTFFIGVILGPQPAAVYGLTVRAHETVLNLLGQFGGSIAASLAHLIGSGNAKRFKELLLRMLPAVSLLGAASVAVVIGVNQEFVNLWVGPKAFAGQSVSVLAGIAVLSVTIGSVAYEGLYSLGRFKLIARTYLLAATIHIALLALLLRFGLWVAPAVGIASSAFWGFTYWRRIAREMDLSLSESRVAFFNALLIAASAVIVGMAFAHWLVIGSSWLRLGLRATACAFTVCVLALTLSAHTRAIVLEEARMTWRAFSRRYAE